MAIFSRRSARALMILTLAGLGFAVDVQTAHAQSSQCERLTSILRQIDSNGDYRELGGNSQAARDARRDVQNMESRYIRDGCNDDAKAGRTLTPQCRQIGREVLRLREVAADVAQQVESANAVAGQREAVLQELARFGCGARGSSATVTNDRQGLFERIFGTPASSDFGDGQLVDGGDPWGSFGYQTVRTVCVRLSDGYFWPISYSTLPDYVSNDAALCQASCPTTPVELYFYDNPGQEPEQMRNQAGTPYTALPSAFAYRTTLDTSPGASCKLPPQSDGSITVATRSDGSTRSMISVGEEEFPLPLRDPRGVAPVMATAEPTQVAALVDVPLPRPRPAAPGETPTARPASTAAADTELRLVQFGDKVVRVVGPDTPYAQPAGAGT